VQLGFVAGTLVSAVLNLPDLLPSRAYFAGCAGLVALANALPLLRPGLASALASRFLIGFFLAGVYPPAMKMIATWFRSGRGLAIGGLVAGLIAGKALPYLLHSLGFTAWRSLLGAASAGRRWPARWSSPGIATVPRPSRSAASPGGSCRPS
jgi:MFS family permease